MVRKPEAVLFHTEWGMVGCCSGHHKWRLLKWTRVASSVPFYLLPPPLFGSEICRQIVVWHEDAMSMQRSWSAIIPDASVSSLRYRCPIQTAAFERSHMHWTR